MQFATPLSPLHEMLVSTWDKNNTCASFNHIQLLSLMSRHYAYQRWHSHLSQRYHCQPNMNKLISLILWNSKICYIICISSQRKKLSQPTPHWSIPPLSNCVFGCLHKHANEFSHDHVNVIWSLKGIEGLHLSTLVIFIHQKISITLKMQASSIVSWAIIVGLTSS